MQAHHHHRQTPATPRQIIADAARRFRAAHLAYGHGTLRAEDEAAWLMVHALGCPFEDLEARLDQPVSATARRRALHLFERRITERLPAAYLTGEAWLGPHRFHVDPRVIIPRSYIAELLQQRLHPWLKPRQSPRTILDLCTGSGCLAIVAAHVFPRAMVDAVDLSAAALAVARRNVRDHRLASRIRLLHSDIYTALAGNRYDLILTNPPYVSDSIMRKLPAEYRHEPDMALHGGADGLLLIRRILQDAAVHLKPHGWLVMETGHQRARVERAFPGLPFIWAETSGGDDCVFLLQQAALAAAMPRQAQPTTPANGRRRRRTAR